MQNYQETTWRLISPTASEISMLIQTYIPATQGSILQALVSKDGPRCVQFNVVILFCVDFPSVQILVLFCIPPPQVTEQGPKEDQSLYSTSESKKDSAYYPDEYYSPKTWFFSQA